MPRNRAALHIRSHLMLRARDRSGSPADRRARQCRFFSGPLHRDLRAGMLAAPGTHTRSVLPPQCSARSTDEDQGGGEMIRALTKYLPKSTSSLVNRAFWTGEVSMEVRSSDV